MGKKKKVDINAAPLQAVTIGEIKNSKYGWIGTILLFILFIGIIYFLPELSKYYQQFLGGGSSANVIVPINNTITNNTVQKEEEPEYPAEKEDNLYTFGSDVKVDIDNLQFTSITLVNNTLSFTIANNSEQKVLLKDLNLYFETYDKNTEDKNILNTIELAGDILPNESLAFNFVIKHGALYFSIKEIKEEDYTYIVLDTDENNVAKLTCEKENEKFVYEFNNDKLTSLDVSISVPKTALDYDSFYEKHYGQVIKYGEQNGINARISTSDIAMKFGMFVDYNSFNSTIEDENYFQKGTSSRVVNFKMQSKLYDCK